MNEDWSNKNDFASGQNAGHTSAPPAPECTCGSHPLAPLYHTPTCPKASAAQRKPAPPAPAECQNCDEPKEWHGSEAGKMHHEFNPKSAPAAPCPECNRPTVHTATISGICLCVCNTCKQPFIGAPAAQETADIWKEWDSDSQLVKWADSRAASLKDSLEILGGRADLEKMRADIAEEKVESLQRDNVVLLDALEKAQGEKIEAEISIRNLENTLEQSKGKD